MRMLQANYWGDRACSWNYCLRQRGFPGLTRSLTAMCTTGSAAKAGTFIKPLQDGDSQELLRRWRCPGMGLHEGSMAIVAIVVLMVCPWLRVTQDGQTTGLDNQPQASYKSPAQARMESDGDLWMSWWQTWDFSSDLCTGCKTRKPCGFQANHGKTWQTIYPLVI